MTTERRSPGAGWPIPHANPAVKLVGSHCYVGNQPRLATAEIQNVDRDFTARWCRPGDWVSVTVEGTRVLLNRDDLYPEG